MKNKTDKEKTDEEKKIFEYSVKDNHVFRLVVTTDKKLPKGHAWKRDGTTVFELNKLADEILELLEKTVDLNET